MLYFSKLRILFVLVISTVFILFSLSNLTNFDDKYLIKINLGLDLQGGSYLLLEIDLLPVIIKELKINFFFKYILKKKKLIYLILKLKDRT